MDFAPSDEQEMIVDTVHKFVERELVPHEDEVERLGDVPPELVGQIRDKALAAGIYAANMPTELGGGGLDNATMAMVARAFGWTQYA
ncbi:MAG: acyl-CoA dehydrogenase family protein, partial [Acidimicrobiales bacterium]|nr:acyl-CoA dehydrogenase family protein [Acidimicrobiales bacterium]